MGGGRRGGWGNGLKAERLNRIPGRGSGNPSNPIPETQIKSSTRGRSRPFHVKSLPKTISSLSKLGVCFCQDHLLCLLFL
jgi:hypothetical protein